MEYMRMKAKQANMQSDNVEMEDMVNSPAHYNKAGIETIDAIQAMTDDGFEFYLQGNIMKYLWRHHRKHNRPLEDVLKAKFFFDKLIKYYAQNKTKDK